MTRTRDERRRGVVAGGLAVALTFGLAGGAIADDAGDQKKKVDRQLAKSRKNLDGISKDLTQAVKTMNSTTKKVGVARTDLKRAEGTLRRANKYNRDIGGRLKVAQANESKAIKALSTNKKAQGKTKVLVGGIARSSYMKGGMGRLERTLDVLTSTGASGSGTGDLALADVLARQQGGVLSQLKGQRATGKSQSARLTGVRTQISSLKRKAQAGVIRARTARGDAKKAKSSLDGLLKKQRSAANSLRSKKKKEQSDITFLQGESKRLGGILRKRAKARAKARAAAAAKKKQAAPQNRVQSKPSDGHFLTGPAPKSQIASPFGYRMHPILHIRRLHGGADYAFGCGAPIYAAASGHIVEAGSNSVSGNHVIIDHGDVGGTSLATGYDHMSTIIKRSGSVKKGQLIGKVGSTGRSTGCHLHFVVLANGQYVNPTSWIG